VRLCCPHTHMHAGERTLAVCVLQASNVCAGPGGQGKPTECILFEASAAQCVEYELAAGAATLMDINGCDAAAVQAVRANAVSLASVAGADAVVGKTSASKIEGVAAVGSAVHSDLALPVEDCLAACALWIKGCTHVSVGTWSERRVLSACK
jgi:hypothetical protein